MLGHIRNLNILFIIFREICESILTKNLYLLPTGEFRSWGPVSKYIHSGIATVQYKNGVWTPFQER
jgi:hypothetical protein